MARTVITPIQCKMNEFVKETTDTDFAALDATDGGEFTMDEKSEKYVIVVKNAASTAVNATAIIKAGDHLQSKFGDISVTLAQNAIAHVVIESARFKNVSGTEKGKVIFSSLNAAGNAGSADIQVKVIKLP